MPDQIDDFCTSMGFNLILILIFRGSRRGDRFLTVPVELAHVIRTIMLWRPELERTRGSELPRVFKFGSPCTFAQKGGLGW